MAVEKTRVAARERRHRRLRKRLQGTPERPRLTVFRSARYIYAQLVDDSAGRTVVQASDVEASVRGRGLESKMARAKEVGALIAQRAKDAGVSEVVFDRGGFAYAGRVRVLAEAARSEGLVF